MPGVSEVPVVRRDKAPVKAGRADRIQLQIFTTTAVHDLCLCDQAQNLVVHDWVVGTRAGGGAVRQHISGGVHRRSAGQMVDRRGVDADTIIVAAMKIHVALVGEAPLEQVVALQLAHTVRDEVVVPIPETLTHILRVHVIGNQSTAEALATNGDRSTKFLKLRWTGLRRPLPEITQIAEVQVVGEGRRDRRCQGGSPVRRLNRTRRVRFVLALSGAGKQSAKIDLSGRQLAERVVPVARHELPLFAEVMIDAAHEEVGALGQGQVAQVTAGVDTVD